MNDKIVALKNDPETPLLLKRIEKKPPKWLSAMALEEWVTHLMILFISSSASELA